MTAMFLTNLMPIIAVYLVWRFLLHPYGVVNQLLQPLARGLLRWLGMVALVAITLAFLFPILWMLTMSFQAGEKMFQLDTEWIPSVWHPENYANALGRANFPLYFLNSGIVSAIVMTGNVVFCTLAGYGLAKFRFPADRMVLLAILSALMLPLEVTLVPTFLVVYKFDWLNTLSGHRRPAADRCIRRVPGAPVDPFDSG